MTSESISIIQKLLETGGIAGLLVLAVWFLAKLLIKQTEYRITNLEQRSNACEQDRATLHQTITALQESRISDYRNRIDILERIAAKVLGDDQQE